MKQRNMSKEQYCALMEIMQLGFVVVDLSLFLDTHPCDTRALNIYNDVAKRYHEKMKEYQRKFAMIMGNSVDYLDPCNWNWIDSPWPWEIEYR